MAAPKIVLPIKRRSFEPVEEMEDEAEVEDELEEVVVPTVRLPARLSKGAPIATVMGLNDLSDEEVVSEMEAAVERASSFGYKIGHIRQHLQNKDYQNASLTTKEALLATLIELVPLAESSLRKSGASKGIYQFNSLIGQVRELLVDLDGERDLNQTIQQILDEAIRPVIMLLAQSIILFGNSLKRNLRAEFDEKQCRAAYVLVDDQLKELAAYVQSMYTDIQKRVEKKLESVS